MDYRLLNHSSLPDLLIPRTHTFSTDSTNVHGLYVSIKLNILVLGISESGNDSVVNPQSLENVGY
jgi:hypothetical protein